MPNASSSVRECARIITEVIARCADDHAGLAEALGAPVAELARRDDLLDIGAPRQGNNVANSWYLYFDGALSILLFEVPDDRTIPPHDHGIWEAFGVYRGRARHRTMRRADDGTVDGYAELETVSEDILEPGELVVIAPPADIHTFEALQAGTYGLTIANGPYKQERLYYQPERNSYVVRQQVNYR